MIRATLDVNVLASGFLTKQAAPAIIIQRWTDGWFELILSEHILSGLERTWQRPYFLSRYPENQVQQTLARLRAEAVLVSPDVSVQRVGEDEEDDLVLGTAVTGSADYLVTGDKHLQSLQTLVSDETRRGRGRPGMVIVSPRQFVDVLDRGSMG